MGNKPTHSVVLSIRAEKEIIASFDWYEGQQKGLGNRFTEKVLQRIDNIQRNPELFSKKYKSYREARVAPFPFVIIYRINTKKSIIRIVSVFHTAQNPGKKYQ